jgi:hypothetical protein
MFGRNSIYALAALLVTMTSAAASDAAMHPNSPRRWIGGLRARRPIDSVDRPAGGRNNPSVK